MAIAPDDPRRAGRRTHGPQTRQSKPYSRQEKLVAVVAAETYGVRETAKALKIGKMTIEKWRTDEELYPYVLTARRQIMGDVADASRKAWAETNRRLDEAPEEIPTRELIAIAAESTNKLQLMSGGATSRTETRDLTEGIDDAKMKVIVNAARRYLEGHGPSAREALAANGRLALPATTDPDPAGG